MYVPLKSNPYDTDFTQERFISEAFGHYRNHHLMMPLMETPQWLNEGIKHLSHCVNVDEERKSAERQARSHVR